MPSAEEHPVILTYHAINAGPSPVEVSPAAFAEHMRWLADHARVVQLAEIVDALKRHRQLPERAVVLTFDDGYADFYQHAAPVLLGLKLPATVFLPTGFVGGTKGWPDSYIPGRQLMSWEQVSDLAGKGIEFGSHSQTHPVLTELDERLTEEELKSSAAAIEARVGSHPKAFCYPYGRWNHRVREAVRRMHDSACSTGAGVVERDADPYALPRIDAYYVRSMGRLRTLFTPGFERYVALRRWIRRVRAKPEGIYSRVAGA